MIRLQLCKVPVSKKSDYIQVLSRVIEIYKNVG